MRLLVLLLALLLPALGFAATCTEAPALDGDGSRWSGWGNGLANTREADGSLESSDLQSLALRWAYGFPGTGSVIGNPVVHHDVLYIGVDSGEVHAIDASSGCTYWVFTSPSGGVRT